MSVNAVEVDCNGEVVRDVPLCGRARLIPVLPMREVDLDTSKPHRGDIVTKVFEFDGKASDGKTYIYRELYWKISWCKCVDGFYV